MQILMQMLKEVGFQAGQHELLSEGYSKDQYKNVQENVKNLKEQRKRIMKDAEKIREELKHSYKSMESTKEKFRKAFDDQEKSQAVYNKANDDGSVTPNEVKKLQLAANKSGQLCEAAKGKYASQLVKTNEFQSKYYKELLPQVLESLQHMEHQRIDTMR